MLRVWLSKTQTGGAELTRSSGALDSARKMEAQTSTSAMISVTCSDSPKNRLEHNVVASGVAAKAMPEQLAGIRVTP